MTALAPNALVLDLVEWVAREPRTHADLIDAWRTSCPRLQIWEDAQELGLVTRTWEPERGSMVCVTDAGRRTLADAGRVP
jgi:hypothetical protein